MKKTLKFVLLTCFSLFISFTEVSAQLAINSNHGNLTECDTLSRDIFIVWWDDDVQDFSNEASLLLDEMIALKDIFLNTYNMQNPIAPGLGFFINVYIHSPGNSNDFFLGNGWGNGVGNDALGGPHWTAPAGILSDSKNTAHETAHIFQWTSNSPGWQFDDSNWFVEASAEWFALTQYPNSPTSHITAKCLTRMPHVPLWLGWTNYPNSYPQNWQRENHQYALGTFFYYLTEVAGVPRSKILEFFIASSLLVPQEYLFNELGASAFRQYFVDFAAHCTNDFDFLMPVQNQNAANEWNNAANPSDNNEFITTLSDAGTNGWFRPANNITTTGWSFNTIKLNNTQNETYTFEIKGDATGSLGDPSLFQGKIVVKNSITGTSFHDVNMINNQEGSISLSLTPNDTEIYMIIASVPTYFIEPVNDFQVFPYEAKITKGGTTTTANIAADNNCINIFPCPANNFFTLQGNLSNYTIDIINSTGSIVQTINTSGTSEIIDISTLPSGLHILRIINNMNNQLHIEQIIKQ